MIEIPEDLVEKAKEYREKMIEAVSEFDDELFEKFVEGTADHERRDPRGHPQGHHRAEDFPGDLRLGVQEQGRPDDAGCGGRLPALAAGCSAGGRHGRRRSGKDADRARPSDSEPFCGAGLQDHDRPVRRPAGVLPGVLGHAERRANRSTTWPRGARSASGACCACTPTSAKRSRKSWRATSARRWA